MADLKFHRKAYSYIPYLLLNMLTLQQLRKMLLKYIILIIDELNRNYQI